MTFLEKISLIKSINIKKIFFFNINTFKVYRFSESKIYYIINKLKVKVTKKEILMHMKTDDFYKMANENNVIFKHFKEGEDEELRCKIQNSVFYDKNRIPLSTSDICDEEYEEYYINDFGVFICKNNGQAIGYGQVILNKNAHTIVNLGILEPYRHQGYGELLIKYLIELCYKNSIKNVYIKVERENINALSLYKKIGFKEYNSIFLGIKI
ncbi:ribosomal-protein-alanine N-acetyltransferase [Clostridium puniceum]|uniref:Ribosomal-protein-alanine N-acetyltransferase n=1 Tax=Clostridium puniceum TaxID=29367 RepID=A0A1S8THY3_9CLOT|nr:GNAT family N-acetyltransferase [Clostridium puniceum]OOM77407.1 ribosomal-protein-alanine N-acetyltransferase [Clostridium puniceum]